MTRFRLAALALPERHRKFAREVFSIVLGVLIALGIGEVADKLRWQGRINNAMVAIRSELSINRWNYAERGIYQPCLEQRLTTIGEILQDARRTHALPAMVNVDKPPIRPTPSYAYQVAIAEGTPARMSPVKARELARIYTSVDIYVLTTRQEAEDWRTLALLETTGGPVSDDLLALLLAAWSSARANAQLVKLVAQQTETLIQKQGIPIEYRPTAPNQAALLKWARARKCRPMLVDGRPASPTPAG